MGICRHSQLRLVVQAGLSAVQSEPAVSFPAASTAPQVDMSAWLQRQLQQVPSPVPYMVSQPETGPAAGDPMDANQLQ